MSNRILICEDEQGIVSLLVAELRHAGYETDAAFDGDEALKLFFSKAYDLILLDLMLPIKSGPEVLAEIRNGGAGAPVVDASLNCNPADIPVIILTARKDAYDKVMLLKSGADDYVTKPFDMQELLARIQRNIERSCATVGKSPIKESSADLHIDYEAFTADVCGRPLSLTKTEFEILFHLMKNRNKVLTRDQILSQVYGYGEFIGDSNVVDVNIKNIRKKMAEYTAVNYIETIRGKGYVIR